VSDGAARLTVMCWNVQRRMGEGPRRRRHLRIAQRIAGCDPDIVCLQEVDGNLLDSLAALLPDYRVLGAGMPSPGRDEFVPVLVHRERCTVLESHSFWLGERPHVAHRAWDARLPRSATAAWLRYAGQPVPVLSCHLDHVGHRARVEGARQLHAWAARNDWAIVAGDLNASPDSPPYRHLVGPAPRLQDARRAAHRRIGPQASWVGPLPGWRRLLDHVLVDHQWRVEHFRTVEREPRRRPVSDHLALTVRLCAVEETS